MLELPVCPGAGLHRANLQACVPCGFVNRTECPPVSAQPGVQACSGWTGRRHPWPHLEKALARPPGSESQLAQHRAAL